MANKKTKAGETLAFNADVGKILHLMIHSLYTNKDIFLRELISNASDACDKLRYLSLTNQDLLKDHPGFKVMISLDKDKRILVVEDTGIGMTKDEMIENLGTIARSGTQGFISQLTGDNKKDTNLIGQFGVGFYSSFMVASHVDVISRHVGQDDTWVWSSTGEGEFTVGEAEKLEHCGTKIILHIREEEDKVLDKFHIRHIIKSYSDHVNIPIEFLKDDGQYEVLNSQSALWMRSKSDVTQEQYEEFYKSVAHAGDSPWITLHNKNEGAVEYTNLLFVPTAKTFDLFHPDRKTRVKLYIRRVFINDESIDIVPAYLRFLRGVVDSEDLPLNISRETLQYNNVLTKIKKSIVSRVLSELKKKVTEDPTGYEEFWKNFGPVIKEGLCEGGEDRDKLLEICKFYSSNSDDQITLDEYIARMKPDQDCIYFMGGDNIETLRNSPRLEGFTKRGIEVLLFSDSVDDFWVNVVNEYKEKPLRSITRSDIDLDKTSDESDKSKEEENKDKKQDLSPALEFIKTTLGEAVQDVQSTTKLTESPVCLAVPGYGMDLRMERFLIDQKQLMTRAQKILEVNVNHPIIKNLEDQIKSGTLDSDKAADSVWLLYDEACILEGEPLHKPAEFAKRLNKLLQQK